MRSKFAALLLLAMISVPAKTIANDDDSFILIAKTTLLNAYKDKLLEKYADLQKCTSLGCLMGTKLDIENIKREIRSLEESLNAH